MELREIGWLWLYVVYFDQRLGAPHPNPGHNSHFQHFLCQKAEKTLKKVVSYVHSLMCYEDLCETMNPFYKSKISEES